MDVKYILNLIDRVAQGKDCIEEGAVGYNGYSFIFKDMDLITPDIDFLGSGGLCSLGSTRQIMKDFDRKKAVFNNILNYNRNYDVLLIGSVKTIVPTLRFGGGYELLFIVWMFVRTPDNKQFPATFYYGPSALAIGGWNPEVAGLFLNNIPKFPNELKVEINFNPHNFTKSEQESLAEALELALYKVPVTDFYGIYRHDFGNRLIGIKKSKPFIVELGSSPNFSDLELFLNHTMKLEISKEEFEDLLLH